MSPDTGKAPIQQPELFELILNYLMSSSHRHTLKRNSTTFRHGISAPSPRRAPRRDVCAANLGTPDSSREHSSIENVCIWACVSTPTTCLYCSDAPARGRMLRRLRGQTAPAAMSGSCPNRAMDVIARTDPEPHRHRHPGLHRAAHCRSQESTGNPPVPQALHRQIVLPPAPDNYGLAHHHRRVD